MSKVTMTEAQAVELRAFMRASARLKFRPNGLGASEEAWVKGRRKGKAPAKRNATFARKRMASK